MNKLLIEFTKSRPRHSNDNGLVETKNGAVIRKVFGHGHIPKCHATKINDFNKKYLNQYLNFHRPCLYPKTETDPKGKIKKHYRYEDMATPYEKLKSLPNAEQYLRSGVNFTELDKIATSITDNEAARQLQVARKQLFKKILFKKIFEQNKVLCNN